MKNKLIFSMFCVLVKVQLIYASFHKVSSLEEYYLYIKEITEKQNLSPQEMLICLDLDGVSVTEENIPLEGIKSKKVYYDLIKDGYQVLMLTARNDGLLIDNQRYLSRLMEVTAVTKAALLEFLENTNDHYSKPVTSILSFNNIVHAKWMDKVVSEAVTIEYNDYRGTQYGYLLNGIFYSGQEKGDMLYKVLPELEEDCKKRLNNEGELVFNGFKALFMVDDQEAYLDTFETSKLAELFSKNMHLIHYDKNIKMVENFNCFRSVDTTSKIETMQVFKNEDSAESHDSDSVEDLESINILLQWEKMANNVREQKGTNIFGVLESPELLADENAEYPSIIKKPKIKPQNSEIQPQDFLPTPNSDPMEFKPIEQTTAQKGKRKFQVTNN